MGIVALAAGFVTLTAAALLVAASLRLPTAIDAALAAYLVFGALAIAIALAVSPFHALTVGGLLLGAVCALGVAITAWATRGRPALPFGGVARAGRDVLRDPPVLILACGVALALAYSAALALATPANNYDSLWYHLARPAFWKQEHAVEYIAGASDARLNVFPPGSEIGSAWPMVLEGSERFASLFQVVALLATIVAAFGISRRLGLTRRQAAFGSLLFASLPVVALQAATPLNDVALCSFLVTAVYFVVSRAPNALALGALALALAVATKASALVAVPLVAVAAAVVRPPKDWLRIAGLGVAALLIGGFWYAVNLVEKGELIPAFGERDEPPERSGRAAHLLGHLTRIMVDVVDPAGAVGRDRFLYVVVAAALALAGVVLAARRRSARAALALAVAAALALLPLAMPSLNDWLLRAHQRLWVELDEPDIAFLALEGDPRVPSPFFSWYGPVGLLVFLAAIPVVGLAVRRGVLRRNTIAFLVAPAWFLVVIVLTLGYHVGDGRYLMPAVALSAATGGLLVDVRPLAWSAAATGMATLLLAFVHYGEKPAGIALLGGQSGQSVWTASRAAILGAAHVPGPFRAIEEYAEPGDRIVLRLRQDDVSYPYFGAALDRHITFVSGEQDAKLANADWLVVAPGLAAATCEGAWTELPSGEAGWRVLRRSGTCASERR
jgi:hypothetical protein